VEREGPQRRRGDPKSCDCDHDGGGGVFSVTEVWRKKIGKGAQFGETENPGAEVLRGDFLLLFEVTKRHCFVD